VGGTLVFGDSEPRPAVSVTMRDVRCVMLNLDPDTGTQDKRLMKTVVRLNDNNAGVYGTVLQTGTIRVGDPVSLVISMESADGPIPKDPASGWPPPRAARR
jgi:hypothetical protein